MRSRKRALRRAFVGLGLGIALLAPTGCRSTSVAAPERAVTEHGAHDGLNAILWVQTAAEYRATTLQAYRSATAHLDLALADPTWTAALEQNGEFGTLPAAVILDMDEAILQSSRFQAGLVQHGESYRLGDWNDWVRTETAEAIPGALGYVRRAGELGVHIFYLTNRTADVEAASLATLRKIGFPVEGGAEDLLTQNERPEWTSDKSSRRAHLARSHRILQIVGDNLNDFTSGGHGSVEERRSLMERYESYWGARWIVLPNPSYGGWVGALFDFEYRLPPDEIRARKRRHLRSWR